MSTCPQRASAAKDCADAVAAASACPWGVGGWWLSGGGTESTENANLHQPRISVAPTVGGRVIVVAVQEWQNVPAGDLLFQVDPQPFSQAVAQADPAVNAARLQVEKLKAA